MLASYLSRPPRHSLAHMCNHYSVRASQAELRGLFDVAPERDRLGNLGPLPAIFPRADAPVVRRAEDDGGARRRAAADPALPGRADARGGQGRGADGGRVGSGRGSWGRGTACSAPPLPWEKPPNGGTAGPAASGARTLRPGGRAGPSPVRPTSPRRWPSRSAEPPRPPRGAGRARGGCSRCGCSEPAAGRRCPDAHRPGPRA